MTLHPCPILKMEGVKLNCLKERGPVNLLSLWSQKNQIPRGTRQNHRAYHGQKEVKFGATASEIYKIMGWFDITNSEVSDTSFKGLRKGVRNSILQELVRWAKDGSMPGKIE